MIEARHITKRYGDRVILDGADISVGGGQAVVLTGDNGSGKTTLLHVLVGLRRPDAGEVVWKGHLLTGAGNTAWRGAREEWGFMPQQVGLPPAATIRQLLHYHARLRRRDISDARTWLERVGLSDAETKRVSELSGGMKQRLAIALTFFFEPELIVMDEPASNLDPGWRLELTSWANEHTRRGAGMLVTSQLDEPWGPNAVRLHCTDGRVRDASVITHQDDAPGTSLDVGGDD